MKKVYECDLCSKTYECKEAAENCEKSHTIYVPQWWWLFVPFYSMILPFYLLIKGEDFIIKNETDKQYFINMGSGVLPLITTIVLLLFIL